MSNRVSAFKLKFQLVSLSSCALVGLVIVSMGCSPSSSNSLNNQASPINTPRIVQAPKLPAVPTLATHDIAKASIIDGSTARAVTWPSESGTASSHAVEITPTQVLRWKADYPMARVHDLAWSPTGKQLAVGGLVHDDEPLFHSPTLLYGEDGTLAEELTTKFLVMSGKGGSISDLEWSSDGRLLATAGGLNMSATLFYPPSKKKVELQTPATAVHAVRCSPDGKFVVLVTGDRDLYLYDADGNRLDIAGPGGSSLHSLAWHPDGTRLACADPLGVMIWGLRANASAQSSTEATEAESPTKAMSLVPLVRVQLPLGKDDWVTTVEWNRNGTRLAVGAFGIGDVWLMDEEGTPLATMRGHTESVWRTRFSSNGTLATSSSDATTRLWSEDGKPLATLISASPQDDLLIDVIEWSPSGDLLAVVSPNDVIRLYSSNATPVATLLGHKGIVQAVSWHPHENRLASADDKKVTHLWNIPPMPVSGQ